MRHLRYLKGKRQKAKIKNQNYDAGLAVVVHFASALDFAVPLTVATAFESIALNCADSSITSTSAS
jgi:hypothetical protein